ncbi:MAG: hypothetical protein EBT92_14620 [Planctomycetes bacterium]|nr:hypothetical protein [Planctomycetota bacterium]NBY01167.1 hypothetical protein [Planctomycetota bacterium]
MASTDPIKITCPECKKVIAVPPDLLGKKVRCKGCSKVFEAQKPAPAKETAKPVEEDKKKQQTGDDPDDDGKAYGVHDTILTARCPNCAKELASEDAIICIFCGYNNLTRQIASTKKTYDITGTDIFIWNLPGIIGAIICLILLIFNIVYMLKIDEWCAAEEGKTEGPWFGFLAHGAIKLWLYIISGFILFTVGKFSFIRLVYENRPKEEEKI